MLNIKVIGAGAAGNKAAINLIEHGFPKDDVVLLNSTGKDIPEEFKDISTIFGESAATLGGCGKEREVGKKLILKDLKAGDVSVDSIADPNTNLIIIVSSTEGGTGSAVTPILAKYIREVMNIPVIAVLFFGFNSDVRGMQNSIEIAQELGDNYGVIGISNAKFLEDANRNKIKAEQMANDHFSKLVSIIYGSTLKAGSQNIDDTDLFKLVSTPGYMTIESFNVNKVKNIEQFNKEISQVIDESKLIDCSERGAKRIGVVYDVDDSVADFVDYEATQLQLEYGLPYEMFVHVQNTGMNEITWISTGMPLPVKEIEEIYERYLKSSSDVKKTKDNFFSSVREMVGNAEDGQFNMLSINGRGVNPKAKQSFFSEFGISDAKEKKPPKEE